MIILSWSKITNVIIQQKTKMINAQIKFFYLQSLMAGEAMGKLKMFVKRTNSVTKPKTIKRKSSLVHAA